MNEIKKMGGDRIYYKNKSSWNRKKTEKNKNKYIRCEIMMKITQNYVFL